MKTKLISGLLLIGIFCIAGFSQSGVTGKVVEVLDARTLVMETSAGRVTVQLQYLEVPEEGQAFYGIARDHLSKLSLGKSVEHKTRRLVKGKSIGRTITFDGIDLSLQMIRDGAAWHEPRETSDQYADEASSYAANQELAKSEKRGIWSIPGMKTPWEVRAENEKLARAQEVARRLSHPTPVGVGTFHSDTRRPSGNYAPTTNAPRIQMDAWVSAFSGAANEPRGLQTFSDPKKVFTSVYTSAMLMDFVSPAGKERLECRALYLQFAAVRTKFFLLGFRAISSQYRFSKGNTRMSVVADGQRINLGAPFGRRRDTLVGAEEIMYYRLTWAQLKKIGSAKKVEFTVDRHTAPLSEDYRELVKQLATATG